jgi:hypothetical protein
MILAGSIDLKHSLNFNVSSVFVEFKIVDKEVAALYEMTLPEISRTWRFKYDFREFNMSSMYF